MDDDKTFGEEFMLASSGDFEIFRANHFEVFWNAVKGFQLSVQMFRALEGNRFKLRVLDLINKREDLWKQYMVYKQGSHVESKIALFQFDAATTPLNGVVFDNVKLIEPPLPFLFYENHTIAYIDLMFEYDVVHDMKDSLSSIKRIYEKWVGMDKEPGELD